MSEQFKIEKGIPVPQNSRGQRGKYPFKTMKIGESFLVPANGQMLQKTQTQVVNSWKHYRPKRFISRQVDGGVRVWRIE